jgi:hypothetical protein
MTITRQQLIERWTKNAIEYEKLSAKAELGDFDDGEIDRSVHYTVIADILKLHATELGHTRE